MMIVLQFLILMWLWEDSNTAFTFGIILTKSPLLRSFNPITIPHHSTLFLLTLSVVSRLLFLYFIADIYFLMLASFLHKAVQMHFCTLLVVFKQKFLEITLYQFTGFLTLLHICIA